MKKMLFLALFLPFVVFAQEKGKSLPEVMLKMEESTIKILKGFLRNRPELILEGANYIKNHPDITDEIMKYTKPERRTPAFEKYIKEFDKLVREEAGELFMCMKNHDKAMASHHFAKMLDRCNGCHAVFRGW